MSKPTVISAIFIFLLIVLILSGSVTRTAQVFIRGTATSTEVSAEISLPLVATSSSEFPTYVEVINGCMHDYTGDCVNLRTGPGTQYPISFKLRTGIVLRVTETVYREGRAWHKVTFVHELAHPERVRKEYYVLAELVHLFSESPDGYMTHDTVSTSTKRIVIDISEQKLYAYDGEVLFMEELISTGLEFTPTPKGVFPIFKMTPSRFMQGPIANVSAQVYDLPGVPWNMYFTSDGAVIHGTYWHDRFGRKWSHGCVNMPPQKAKILYHWAEIGTKVIVQK